ncbi:hypothetical protein GWK47_043113 [Chionoecetes opilio]|uniref:Uncharacterized protein n=1 Tax=Chionoecetes opilio TaxID=41210 RepID=A0A8J4Y9L7_CHIOP|nr:hypothetical protein GWK47_043113 [Chionoecetes opilio]
MEYAPLTWSSCPPSYLCLLDKVQARAQRLILLKALPDQLLTTLQPLQQRRDVAGLCVVYKTYKQHIPHLAVLRQPWARPHGHITRTAVIRDHQLIVPLPGRRPLCVPSFHATQECGAAWYSRHSFTLPRHSRPSRGHRVMGVVLCSVQGHKGAKRLVTSQAASVPCQT